jgi:hypothetical protein
MEARSVAMLVLVLVLAACGGGGPDGSSSDDTPSGDGAADTSSEAEAGAGDLGSGGEVVDPQPPGQATVSVDGQEWAFTEPGATACTIATDAIGFSFRIGDNEVTLGGGANLYDTGWLGGIDLRVADPDGADGPVTYFPDLAADGAGIAIDGDSMSYSGPMQMQPPNDGSNPPPEDVGDGTISVTCGRSAPAEVRRPCRVPTEPGAGRRSPASTTVVSRRCGGPRPR